MSTVQASKVQANTKRLLLLLTSGLVLLLTACSVSTINIRGTYPTPLVGKLPLKVGVYYDESFVNHSFTEINDRTGKDQLIVKSGSSQVELFNTVLPALFEEVVVLENKNAQSSGLDLVLVPTVQEFQLGLPEKTRLKVYEVWIKYNMQLSDGNGEFVADWVMTAYGKSPEESFQSKDEGVNNAAVVALRDLAATFTLGFTRVPEVNEWLRAKSLIR